MDSNTLLIEALLPKELFQYFEIVNVIVQDKTIDVYLDEKNVPPPECKYVSKGFHEIKVIQDFPIRDKAVYHHIRRRKWKDEKTGEVVSKSWDLTAKGTRYTKDFASFLKELLG
jgi:transposase